MAQDSTYLVTAKTDFLHPSIDTCIVPLVAIWWVCGIAYSPFKTDMASLFYSPIPFPSAAHESWDCTIANSPMSCLGAWPDHPSPARRFHQTPWFTTFPTFTIIYVLRVTSQHQSRQSRQSRFIESLSHWVTTSFNSTRQGTICRWSRWSLLLSHHVAALPEADGEPHLSWLGDTFVMGDPWSPRISHACKDSASEMGTTSTPAMVTGPEKRWSEMAHRRTDSMTLCSTLLRAQWEPALNTQVSSCRDRILSSYHTTIRLGDAAWTSQRRCPAFVKRSW
jgi:hypothetical protein